MSPRNGQIMVRNIRNIFQRGFDGAGSPHVARYRFRAYSSSRRKTTGDPMIDKRSANPIQYHIPGMRVKRPALNRIWYIQLPGQQ